MHARHLSVFPRILIVLFIGFGGCGLRAQVAPTAAPSASATATPAFAAPPKYDGSQQAEYIATGSTAFVVARKAKFQAFMDARTAFEAAGGISPAGLTSKAAVTDRRALLTTCRTAADDYLAFTTTQDDTYRAELAKTPLIPADIDSIVSTYEKKTNTPRAIQLQQYEKDLLACNDAMLGDLEKWDGKWSVSGSGRLTFKRKANQSEYAELEKKYNALVTQQQKLMTEGAAPVAFAIAGGHSGVVAGRFSIKARAWLGCRSHPPPDPARPHELVDLTRSRGSSAGGE